MGAGGAGEYRLVGGGALWLPAAWGGGAGEYLDTLAVGVGKGAFGDGRGAYGFTRSGATRFIFRLEPGAAGGIWVAMGGLKGDGP